MKKRIAASVIVTAAILATGGTAVAASTLKTVSQKAAEAAPPSPSVTTVTVGKRQLFDQIDLTCNPGYRAEESISGSGKAPLVLTAAPLKAGDAVGDGTLLGEINGAPVFAITGAFPLYRDLKLQDSGPDARMVNDALVRAGLLLPQADPAASTITAYTSTAIASLFTRSGYAAPKPSDPVVGTATLQVIPEGGTVSGSVHSRGLLGTEAIATIGVGTKGLICTGPGGKVPVEAKNGQQVRITALGPELRPVAIIPIKAAAAPVTESTSPAQTSGAPSTVSPGTTSTALFVEADTANVAGTVSAALILSQSTKDPLVVPSSALWTLNGQTLVSVQDSGGSRDVPVNVVFSAGGENAVSPASQDSVLKEGDNVVVAGTK